MITFINNILSNFFSQKLPRRNNTFYIQKELFQRLLNSYSRSPLYEKLWLKQVQQLDLTSYNEKELKLFISNFSFVEYRDHILPLLNKNCWITTLKYDLCIKTSGTSDANQWWKLIPAQWSSFKNESLWIYRTLSYYLKERSNSRLFFKKSFSLTAPFDIQKNQWYVSGAIRYYKTSLWSNIIFLPLKNILLINDRWKKKNAIIDNMIKDRYSIWSIHWVPTWPLEIIDELISKDIVAAKKVLSWLEYVSIWWWAPLNYKQQFKDKLLSLGILNEIAGSNNHNASEWFLWSQIRNFFDLSYHWMSPMIQTNFFLFVPVDIFELYIKKRISYWDMIIQSSFLHEVDSKKEYLMMFANDRIPRLYNIKDRVVFKDNSNEWWDALLEYIVTGRYGMSSNVFNEHIEYNHLIDAFKQVIRDWYYIDKNNFVAGMELLNNQWVFHIIIESHMLWRNELITNIIDKKLWIINEQWKIFRQRWKIKTLNVLCVPIWSIRNNLISLGKMHEQSKIPHLSDNNYENIIKPLLENKKR